ncbi:MAG: 5-dehydro-2-deoxygluconokinase [Acidobacteria bacterium]|nr:5-dehydro-2-deoxygluconokinase [Acidobacteriota bacterium]
MDVAILGRIGYDLYSEEPDVRLPNVRTFSRYLGGSSANMAVGLTRLGAKVSIISALGTDALSDFLVDFLNKEGVDTARVQRKAGYLPSLCLTEVTPPDRFPQVFYRHDAVDTLLETAPGDLEAVGGARMFITNGTSLCASPSREATYRALERAKAAGAKVVFDVDFRAMSWKSPEEAGLAVRLALPYIDVLIGNQPELMLVAATQDLDSATAKLKASGVSVLVSKLGEQGTRVFAGGAETFLPPYKVDVCTTIGAGDGFASGFLYALLQGLPIEECLHHGNAAAAIVVSRLSCSEAMPRLEEVKALMSAQRRDR